MKPIRIAAAILAGSATLIALPALATDPTSSTATIGVNLRVYHECTILTHPLTFDATGITDTDISTTATITVDCTERSPYAIAIDAGQNGAGNTEARKMKNGAGDFIGYDLYSDNGTTPWGNEVGTDTVDNLSPGATQATTDYTVTAVVPAFHNKPAGSYSDTVTATIWYGGAETP